MARITGTSSELHTNTLCNEFMPRISLSLPPHTGGGLEERDMVFSWCTKNSAASSEGTA